MKKYTYKVKGGKLLIIKIEIENNLIKKFQLLGDFFLYPEEKISSIENVLINTRREDVLDTLKNVIQKEKIQLLGFTEEDIVLLINQAFEDEKNNG